MDIFQRKFLSSLLFFGISCFLFPLKAQQAAAPQDEVMEAEQRLKQAGTHFAIAVGAHGAISNFVSPAHFVQKGLTYIPFVGEYLATVATDAVVNIEAVQWVFDQWRLPFTRESLVPRLKVCLHRCTQLAEILVLLSIVGFIGSHSPSIFSNITSSSFLLLESVMGYCASYLPYCLSWLSYPLKIVPYIPFVICNLIGWSIINGIATKFNPVVV